MIFLSAHPDIPFYHWQVEVQLFNFKRLGIDLKNVHSVFNSGNATEGLKKLMKRYPEVNFGFYPDTRDDKSYIPSIRPHILEKHFNTFPELANEVIFYHDCDIIFQKLPEFDRMLDDNMWYLSDTNSYINSTYIKSKGIEIFEHMCKIVGVEPADIEAIDHHSGGAQYLMKGINADFWKKIYKDSNALYSYMNSSIKYFSDKFDAENAEKFKDMEIKPKYHPIQAWCADMWAVLWNGVLLGNEMEVDPNLAFSWGTSSADQFHTHTIFHNAGVTPTLPDFKEMFYKGEFHNQSPFDANLSYVTDKHASYFYVQEILATKKFIEESFSF